MKKVFAFSLVIAAIAVVSCQKEQDVIIEEPIETVEFNVVAGDLESKTAAVDGATPSIKWLSTDAIKVYEIITSNTGNDSVFGDATSSTTVLSNSDKTASFKVTLTGTPSNAVGYKYSAVYPASAVDKPQNSEFYRLLIPKNQHLNGNNFSSDSDVLISSVYDNGANRIASDENVNFSFKRIGTVVKLTLQGITANEKIQTIVLTAPVNIAGRVKYYPITGTIDPESWNYDNTTSSKTMTLTADDIVATGNDVVWFRVLCAENWAEGSKFSISVETDKANYIKNDITIPDGKTLKFIDGGLTGFTVNLSTSRSDKPVEKTYNLITDVSDLTIGSTVIIADFGDNNSAISLTQNTNNRAGTTAKKSNDKSSITTSSISIQEFTVVAGNKSGTVAFYTGDGYIYASSSSSNYLKTEENLSNNSSWSVDIEDTGEATIVAQGTNTRNKIRFNPNNGTPIFSCYASSSTTGTPVSIYKLEDLRAESGIAWSENTGMGDMKNQELALPSLTNPNSLSVSYSSSDPTVATVASNAHTVTLLKAGTTEIHAVFAGDATYKSTDVYYTLTVDDTRTNITLSFVTPSYSFALGSDDYNSFVGQAVNSTPSVSGIIYELTGDAIGTINSATGVVTLDDSTTGSATVTATFAGNDTQKYATASYTIEVTDGSGSTTVTFVAGTDKGETSVTIDGITVSMSTMNRDDNYRTYANSSMTVTASGGKTITSIVVTCTANGTSNYGPGKFSGEGYVASSGKTGTWTGSATSVSLDASAQVRMTQIEVTYN